MTSAPPPDSIEALFARFGPAYRWLVTATVMMGTIATILTATIVNVALPDIMGAFGMGQDKAQLLSTGFLAAMTGTMLLNAWMVETLGQHAVGDPVDAPASEAVFGKLYLRRCKDRRAGCFGVAAMPALGFGKYVVG